MLPVIDVFVPAEAPDARVGTEAFVPSKQETVRYIKPVAGDCEQTGEQAIADAISHCEEKGVGKGVTRYRLRDWGISRQRYLGMSDTGIVLREMRLCRGEQRQFAGAAARGHRFQSAGKPIGAQCGMAPRSMPALRRTGAAGNRHHGYVRGQLLVFCPFYRAAGQDSDCCG